MALAEWRWVGQAGEEQPAKRPFNNRSGSQMYKIKADTLVATRSGVRVGLRVQLQTGGPVRFSEILVPWDLWDRADKAEALAAFNRQVELEPEDAALF